MAELLDGELLAISCPRCGTDVSVRFYGSVRCLPGRPAREAGQEAHEVVTEAYEPKMNVTPNAVALKD
jgi:hypothetical protein